MVAQVDAVGSRCVVAVPALSVDTRTGSGLAWLTNLLVRLGRCTVFESSAADTNVLRAAASLQLACLNMVGVPLCRAASAARA